jgi:large conductance mechanosensitive channel
MDEKFAVLSKGPNFDQQNGYNTLYQAREDGALVLAYGYVDLPQLLVEGPCQS